MNIILLNPEEVVDSQVTLTGDRARHIVKVLRSAHGDTIKVGVIDGKVGTGMVRDISIRQPYSVVLDVILEQTPMPEPSIDILLALPRPIMFKRILSQAATLGTGHLFVVNANRVEKSFWSASITTEHTTRPHLLDGLQQAADTRLPSISFHKGFKPFIESDMVEIAPRYKQMLVAHPDCRETLNDVYQSGPGRTLLAVGPEGGWVEYELRRLHESGFSPFSLGPRILKVETAVTALHSMVSLLNDLTYPSAL